MSLPRLPDPHTSPLTDFLTLTLPRCHLTLNVPAFPAFDTSAAVLPCCSRVVS